MALSDRWLAWGTVPLTQPEARTIVRAVVLLGRARRLLTEHRSERATVLTREIDTFLETLGKES